LNLIVNIWGLTSSTLAQKINKLSCLIKFSGQPFIGRMGLVQRHYIFPTRIKSPDGMGKIKARDLNLKAIRYCLIDQVLYWKDPLGVLLRCLDPQEAQKIMFDFHDSLCGGHHFWRTTAYKILRVGYFWPTLFTDVCEKIRACIKCQKFTGKKQLKSLPLKPVVTSGPFQQWGLDFIGEIHPPSSGQHRWILTATDYFTKWIEAIPTRSASHRVIIGFLEDIMARFGCLEQNHH
jgi:hypothetical protein